MDAVKYDKLLLAVVQGNDSEILVKELNHAGFYVTILNSMGGFLKRRSVTLMVGLQTDRLDEALEIIKQRAGRRVEETYHNPAFITESFMDVATPVPMSVPCGGATVFVIDMERMERY